MHVICVILAVILVKIDFALSYIVTELDVLIFLHMCQLNQNQVNFTGFNLILS